MIHWGDRRFGAGQQVRVSRRRGLVEACAVSSYSQQRKACILRPAAFNSCRVDGMIHLSHIMEESCFSLSFGFVVRRWFACRTSFPHGSLADMFCCARCCQTCTGEVAMCLTRRFASWLTQRTAGGAGGEARTAARGARPRRRDAAGTARPPTQNPPKPRARCARQSPPPPPPPTACGCAQPSRQTSRWRYSVLLCI